MTKRSSVLCAVAFMIGAVACGGTDASVSSDQGQDDNLTSSSAAKQLRGSWVGSSTDVGSMAGLDLRPDGHFFYDEHKVLNGMFINGAVPLARTEGTWSLQSGKQQLTLHVTSPVASTEVYHYTYTPAPIMNGVFKPGFEPEAKLTITLQPAPGSHVAYPAINLTHADSWCTTDTDCKDEKSDGTWTNIGQGDISCGSGNVCEPSLHL